MNWNVVHVTNYYSLASTWAGQFFWRPSGSMSTQTNTRIVSIFSAAYLPTNSTADIFISALPVTLFSPPKHIFLIMRVAVLKAGLMDKLCANELNYKDDNIHKSEALKRYDIRTSILVERQNWIYKKLIYRFWQNYTSICSKTS